MEESRTYDRKDRNPAVAGSFYPAGREELAALVTELLGKAVPPRDCGAVRALVVPHAGYVYSGGVAASGYRQLDPDQAFERIFILASSHRFSFGKAAVFSSGDYLTPLGRVPVDTVLASELCKKSAVFTEHPDAHRQEHSIEVQLPFLQQWLKKPFRIVPIILGTQVPGVCREIADALAPYFVPGNLFIVSADLSHYPSYEDAKKVDAATTAAFCSGSPATFLDALRANERRDVSDLATSMCAWPAGLTLLYLCEGKGLSYNLIEYRNSGDSKPYGDRSSVVGYSAISITEQPSLSSYLSAEDKSHLLKIARTTLEEYITNSRLPALDTKSYSTRLKEKAGAFVTLKVRGELRGCIGSFEPDTPLYRVIQEMTVASSTRDSRFSPVRPDELRKIDIEISVLTPMRKIKDISEIKLGKHGIYIRQGYRSGTFLPQVATETGWDLEEFLGHCARDKAGIGWTGWKDADLFTYEAIVFGEDSPKAR